VEIFFHARSSATRSPRRHDPGNILVAQDGRYIALDFGIMGRSPMRTAITRAELLGFFQRDYKRVAQAHVDAGWVPHWARA